MADVKIADILQSTLWTQDFINEDPILKNILESGILIDSAELKGVVNSIQAGSRFELPYIDEPQYAEPLVMDDSDTEISSNKVSWSNMFAVLGLYATSWGYKHITQVINRDSDPAKVLRNIIANYWAKDLQNRIINSLVGISNKAGSDLTLDVSDDTADGDSVVLNADIIIDGVNKQGDNQDKFGFMYLHSKVYSDLKKQGLIETIQPQEVGAKPIQVYGNYKVIVNDLMPVVEGTNKKKYTTIIAQSGVFAYAQKELEKPFAIDTNEKAGRGAGKTDFISRNGFVLHPIGFSWTKSTGLSPTLAQLASDANWGVKFQPKQQRFVKIVTN